MELKSATFIPYSGTITEDGEEYGFKVKDTCLDMVDVAANPVVYIYSKGGSYFGSACFHANPTDWSEEGITVGCHPHKLKVNGNVLDELKNDGESVRFELKDGHVVGYWRENTNGLYYFTHPDDGCDENHFLNAKWWSPRHHIHIPPEPKGTITGVSCDAIFEHDNWKYREGVSESQMKTLAKIDMAVPQPKYIKQALLLNRIGEMLREQTVIKSYE